MLRALASHLVAPPIVMFAIVVIGLACSAPPDDSPGSPAALATNVRRTAVAEVQAIIANKPTSTPLPEATATPMPSCPNAIWWTEARTHTGESRTIQGRVVQVRSSANGATLVELGQPYPDPTGLVVVLASGDASNLASKSVCVAGRITLEEGRPTLQVRDAAAFLVVD